MKVRKTSILIWFVCLIISVALPIMGLLEKWYILIPWLLFAGITYLSLGNLFQYLRMKRLKKRLSDEVKFGRNIKTTTQIIDFLIFPVFLFFYEYNGIAKKIANSSIFKRKFKRGGLLNLLLDFFWELGIREKLPQEDPKFLKIRKKIDWVIMVFWAIILPFNMALGVIFLIFMFFCTTKEAPWCH